MVAPYHHALLFSVVMMLTAGSACHAADAEVPNCRVKQKLLAFCARAQLHDRGVTNTPFYGSSERWIVTYLAAQAEFQHELNLSEDQIELMLSLGKTSANQRSGETFSDIIPSWKSDAGKQYWPKLKQMLSAEQQALLLSVFLNVEGLTALHRDEFVKSLTLTEKQQQRIEALISNAYEKSGLPLHRAIFTLSNDNRDEFPLYHAALRNAACKLDESIIDELSSTQQELLLGEVKRAIAIAHAVPTPGP